MFAKKNVKNICALTPLQEGILFHALYSKENATYFEQFNYHISGKTDIPLFEAAWNELMRRHDIFRTVFVHKNVPQPLQIVLKERKIDFTFEDIRSLSPEAQRDRWLVYREKDKKRYFDLSKDALMRVAVFQLAENSFNITWSFHHIVMDGWSVGIVYDELITLYHSMRNGNTTTLPAPVSFGEYVKWLKKQDTEAAKDYWRKYLADYRRLTGLPRILGEKKKEFVKKTFEFKLSETMSQGLRDTAARHHVTVNTVIQVIWGILLGKYNDATDAVFAATVSGRPADLKGVERIVGLFINAIPVRIQMRQGQTTEALLQKTHHDAAENKDYHYYSLADIQSETLLKQRLLDHLLIFESYPDLGKSEGRGETEFVIDEFEQFELTNYDLSVQVFPEETFHFCVIYNASVYEQNIIEKIEPHLKTIIESILKDAEVEPSQIALLSPDEQETYRKAANEINESLLKLPVQRDGARSLSAVYAEPENEAQEKLVSIWKEVMNVGTLGIDDNFFELGGHSLMATRIVSRIHKIFEVEITLQEFFDRPNVRKLSEVISRHAAAAYSEIEVIPEQEDYEVSHSQRRLWILDRMEENFIAYNQSAGFLFKGDMDIPALKRAVRSVCRRHESLRTVFVMKDGTPRQKIQAASQVEITETDLSRAENKEDIAKNYARKEATLPFDLEKGPLLRVSILRLTDDSRLLLINIHHIICDGWSVVLFENEILTLYKSFTEGHEADLSPLKIQYKDYSAWHNRLLESENIRAHQAYWHQKLSGELPVLNLPTDYPRPATLSYKGNTVTHVLNAELSASLDQFCREKQVSLFMTLLAGAKVLLHRYTGQNDIIIGSPIAGRIHPDLEHQIGFFVNTLALRDTVLGDESFMTLLSKVKQTTLEAYQHQVYPFDKLVEELDVQRDISRSPIFDVMLVLQNTDEIKTDLPNVEIKPFAYETGVSQFDLTLIFTQDEGKLRLDMNCNTDLFANETILRMGRHFEEVLKSILSAPEHQIRNINLLSAAEKQQILFDFNNTKAPYPEDKTLADLFEEQVIRTPDNIAVIFEEKQMTYRELNDAADRLAHDLRDKYQIQPDDLVAVMMKRSEQLIVSLLGILKAGGAYLPIDPAYPQKRIDYMLNDSACKVCIGVRGTGLEVRGAGAAPRTSNLKPQTSNLAYVIYTSGSTGQPKGVMIEHRGFVNMTLDQIRGFGVSESDRVLQFSSPSFDASLSEIFMALLKGAALVMISTDTINDSHRFLEYIERHKVSVITFPPVYLNMLNKHPLPTVRTIITAGEPAILGDVLFYCKDRQYFNAYGPTETSVCTSYYRVPPDFRAPYSGFRIPIGAPIANSSVFIVDESIQPVPVGVTGEICFSGVGLARGYLNKPELTAEKFVENPFHPGTRLYKIGDLGKWLPDGNIVFLGRKDDQVKVRGFRIELGEIESRLKQHPQITDALVLAVGENENSRQLVAYLITHSEINLGEMRNFLGESLPPFMMPNHFVSLEKFPLTVNGKIDKRALPGVSSDLSHGPDDMPPRNETEATLLNVWKKLFQKEKIGIYDDFFALGGDSVKAIQTVSLLHEQNLKVRAKDIFQYPTVAQLAKAAVLSGRGLAANQEMISGYVPLTPITAWFFKEFTVDRHHFNHSDLFCVRERLDEDALRAAFAKIQEHHDALRMRCRFENGNWKLEIAGDNYPLHFEVTDLRNSEQAVSELESHAQQLQSSLNLKKGPLMKAVLFRMPHPECQNEILTSTDRLLIIVHHLVIDGVSWRFFLEDLLRGYEQYLSNKTVTLPPKSDSFKEWAEGIQTYSSSDELLGEKEYWRQLEATPTGELPWDDDSSPSDTDEARMKHTFTADFNLSQAETEMLLTCRDATFCVSDAARTDELLLTALAWALKQWHGHDRTLIHLEGHGREDIVRGTDVSRTVGWFTAVYPVILDSPDASDAVQIGTIKGILRNIPNRGMGYGILKYVTPSAYKQELKFNLKPRISFNYLGEMEAYGTGIFERATESCGNAVSPDAKLIHDIDINAVIIEKKLHIDLTANGLKCRPERIEKILSDFKNKLKEIIAKCEKI